MFIFGYNLFSIPFLSNIRRTFSENCVFSTILSICGEWNVCGPTHLLFGCYEVLILTISLRVSPKEFEGKNDHQFYRGHTMLCACAYDFDVVSVFSSFVNWFEWMWFCYQLLGLWAIRLQFSSVRFGLVRMKMCTFGWECLHRSRHWWNCNKTFSLRHTQQKHKHF